jgi:phosphatidate cytidylyltransferase
MSDDRWRRDGRGEDPETSEFGGPLFPDDPADEPSGGIGRPPPGSHDRSGDLPDTEERRLRFGPDDTGPLPHWTDPPTGEIPRLDPRAGLGDQESDEVDVWSTFTTESPVWRDDVDENMVTGVIEQVPSDFGPPSGNASGSVPRTSRDPSGATERGVFDRGSDYDPTGGYDRDPSGSHGRVGRDPSASGGYDRPGDPSGGLFGDYGGSAYGSGREPSGSVPRTAARGNLTGEVPLPPRREPGRITIGTDPSGMPRRSPDPRGRRPGAGRGPTGRPIGPARTSAPPSQRDMTTAIVVALILAGVFVAALIISPAFTLVIVAVVMALAGWEYFGKVTEKGYRPAVAVGLAACLFAPIAAYFYGEMALPLVVVLAFMTAAAGFIATPGVESGPLPNMAVTTLGVVWIGVLGAYAGLILRFSTSVTVAGDSFLLPGSNLGTDTLFMIALGVAANDIGALMVGSAVGKTPLRAWVSPSKTIEGLLGGTIATFFALFIASKIVNDQNAWSQNKWILLLALAISILAPLGDLTESMFKRNLEIKDFGTIVQGHGGVLDRFDGFLFVLPGVYYLTLLLGATS